MKTELGDAFRFRGATYFWSTSHEFFKTISPALILGLAVATGANAQAFGVVETGGAFGVGTGAVPVAVAPAPTAAVGIPPVTGFATGLGGLGAAGSIGLGLGAIVAVGAISGGGSTSSTN